MRDKIKNTIEELLRKMSIAFDAIEVGGSDEVRFHIRTPESGLLIGNKGANLSALNYLIKRMFAKEAGAEEVKFYIDVNNYQEKVLETLRNTAKIMSERARSFKVSVELDPMPPYERRIIHTCLENIPDIKTESSGTGENRRVVIRYVGNERSLDQEI